MDIKSSVKAVLPEKLIDFIKEIYPGPENCKIEHAFLQYCTQNNLSEQKLSLKQNILEYVNTLRVKNVRYRFSEDTTVESLYASTFACLIRGFYDDISESSRTEWLDYFNQCQRPKDGLFDDGIVNDTLYFSERKGYGARHLAGIIINAYDRLKGLPQYEFSFLNEYKDPDKMIKFLSGLNYRKIWGSSNEIMNCGAVMQFARDRMGMPFGPALEAMEDFLITRIRPEYGLWFEGQIDSKSAMYEAIRGAYHIIPILWYDQIEIPYAKKCLKLLYHSQNKWGGFHNQINSSACADIDAIDPLLRLSIQTQSNSHKLNELLENAEQWILFNQNPDGGFVFSRKGIFDWGGQKALFSQCQHSNIFATWFRTLALQFIDNYRSRNNQFRIQTPGSECPLFHERK